MKQLEITKWINYPTRYWIDNLRGEKARFYVPSHGAIALYLMPYRKRLTTVEGNTVTMTCWGETDLEFKKYLEQ